MRKLLLATVARAVSAVASAKNFEKQTYTYPSPYVVEKIEQPKGDKIKNVILMIGDGMSLVHIQSAWTCNRGKLWLENCPYTGLQKTPIANQLIADSASGGTALATGNKTNYHWVGVDAEGNPVPSLINYAHDKGLSTGIAVTCRLWDATPCDFLCHTTNRDLEEDLIAQYPNAPVDYVFGGGAQMFKPDTRKTDDRDVFGELKKKGYNILRTWDEFKDYNGGKAYCVPFEGDTPVPAERGDLLARAALKEIELLKKNDNGFFLMVEGSQLDDYGHFNRISTLMEETLDFDQTVGKVLKWAAEDGETLVVITADHETGGLSLIGGDLNSGTVEVRFTTDDHSGTIVPVYAFGPGAENFTGFMLETDICWKIKSLLKM